ncbi:MAG: TetR/AcrR family transcriptional regulator [Anaerolineaceae bacterium]
MTNIPPFELLDIREQRSLDLLYEAFLELLKSKHYKLITIKEITNKARINRATFYNHFNNYHDFIIYCTREGFRRALEATFPSSTFEYNKNNFYLLLSWVLDFMSIEYDKWHYQWDELLSEKGYRIEFSFYLSKWINPSGKYRSTSVTGDIRALSVSASFIGLVMVWCDHGKVETKEELIRTVIDTYANGLPGLADE